MPKAASGPKLVLYGPDTKHGAKRKARTKSYLWYVVWNEGGRKYERATGAELRERAQADEALESVLAQRRTIAAPASGYHPHQVTIGQILHKYVTEKAPQAVTHERICHAVDAMMPFWRERLLSEVGRPSCTDYIKWRARQPSKNYRVSLAAWERGKSDAKARRVPFTEPKPAIRGIALRTIRTELEYLRSAISYCREEVFITAGATVTLPEKGEPRGAWLERGEFARLLLAARERVPGRPEVRRHLIVYLLVGVYQPARKTAILQLPLVQPVGGGAWLDAKNGRIDFGPGSGNKKRPRLVPIHPRLLAYVRAALARGQRYLVEFAERRSNETDEVRRSKTPLKNIRRSFAGAVRRAAIDKHVTPHTLRHTGVTWLKLAGGESWMVGGYAGMTKETVDNIYAHHHPDHMKGVTQLLTGGRRK